MHQTDLVATVELHPLICNIVLDPTELRATGCGPDISLSSDCSPLLKTVLSG